MSVGETPTGEFDKDKPFTFDDAFETQRMMQAEVFGNDVRRMSEKEKGGWIGLNTLAQINEINECLDECPAWKPWASTDVINYDAARGELVDEFHFFMNKMDALAMTPQMLLDGYRAKQKRNVERQQQGYTGLEKCPGCKRAWDDIDTLRESTPGNRHRFVVTIEDSKEILIYCGRACWHDNEPGFEKPVQVQFKEVRNV